MAHKNKVMQSINAPSGAMCVDVFRRPEGNFGFEEFRRDPEDPSGWFNIGHHGTRAFATEQEARAEADRTVAWLAGL